MKGIVISVRGFGLAALIASAPAAAQVILNASSWVSPGHPLTATMLAPFCADIEKATAARVKCNILPKAPVGRMLHFTLLLLGGGAEVAPLVDAIRQRFP